MGDLAAARRAHAEYFAALADTAHSALREPDWRAWVGRLELEHDNLWAALTYAQEAPDAGIAARLGTLAWYFTLAERVSEGRRFVELQADRQPDDVIAASLVRPEIAVEAKPTTSARSRIFDGF